MPHLSDLIRRYTALSTADLEWLHALVSDWQLLADLSFADLLLWTRLREDNGWIGRPDAADHRCDRMQDDLVETILYDAPTPGEEDPCPSDAEQACADRPGWREGRVCRKATRTGQAESRSGRDDPVRREGTMVAVISRAQPSARGLPAVSNSPICERERPRADDR